MKNPYKLNTSHYGTHQIIAREIGSAKSVLDVGCNEGYLKQLNSKPSFVGIDYSKNALKIAKENGYKKVIQADLNKYSKVNFKAKVDLLVFADILEHLINPSAVLEYFINKNLKAKGRVIISLPNVAHFSTRLLLLMGKFDYTDAGILDRTHLHLYTLSSAKSLAHESKLKINKVTFSSNRFGRLIQFFPILGPILGFNIILVCQKS